MAQEKNKEPIFMDTLITALMWYKYWSSSLQGLFYFILSFLFFFSPHLLVSQGLWEEKFITWQVWTKEYCSKSYFFSMGYIKAGLKGQL